MCPANPYSYSARIIFYGVGAFSVGRDRSHLPQARLAVASLGRRRHRAVVSLAALTIATLYAVLMLTAVAPGAGLLGDAVRRRRDQGPTRRVERTRSVAAGVGGRS